MLQKPLLFSLLNKPLVCKLIIAHIITRRYIATHLFKYKIMIIVDLKKVLE